MVLSETVNLVPKNNICEIRGEHVFSILVTIRVFVEKKKSRFLIDIHKQYNSSMDLSIFLTPLKKQTGEIKIKALETLS